MTLVDRRHLEQVTASTSSSGSGNAASVKLGYARGSIDIYYDLSAINGDITVEVSEDGSNWRAHDSVSSGNLNTGGDMLTSIADTTYEYARVYYGGNDSDVSSIVISGG